MFDIPQMMKVDQNLYKKIGHIQQMAYSIDIEPFGENDGNLEWCGLGDFMFFDPEKAHSQSNRYKVAIIALTMQYNTSAGNGLYGIQAKLKTEPKADVNNAGAFEAPTTIWHGVGGTYTKISDAYMVNFRGKLDHEDVFEEDFNQNIQIIDASHALHIASLLKNDENHSLDLMIKFQKVWEMT